MTVREMAEYLDKLDPEMEVLVEAIDFAGDRVLLPLTRIEVRDLTLDPRAGGLVGWKAIVHP